MAFKKSATPATTEKPVAATPAPVKSETKGSGTSTKPAMTPGSVPTAAPYQPSYDEIAQRAYQIYAGRGYVQGDPTADWLEAEAQLKAGR